MGLYERQVLPRVLNVACGAKMVEPLRRRVCDGLAGEVVEIGFGSGLNIPFYPAAVTVCRWPRIVNRRLLQAGRSWLASVGWMVGDPDRVNGRRRQCQAVLVVQRVIP